MTSTSKAYPHLFTPGKIGKRTVKNRIVMAPMSENMANADGSVSQQSIAYFTERAKGGAGILLVGIVSVEFPRGKGISNANTLDGDKYVKDWERLARSVHRYGALLIPQIQHSGMNTWKSTIDGQTPVRVAPEPEGQETGEFHVLTKDDIKMLEQKFIQAAVNAQLAGCDGVEVHSATGYLLSQFINPAVNTRTDEYGGSLENRTRLAVDIIKGIRKACGSQFIIGVRMPVHKWESDHLTDEESVQIAKMYEAAGVDYLNLNVGYAPNTTATMETGRYQEGDRLDLPGKIMGKVNVPIFAVGMLKEPEMCEQVIREHVADFVVLGRALIADPFWPEKARAGRADEIRNCLSCLDGCYENLLKNVSIRCAVNPQVGYEWERDMLKAPGRLKKVLVIGGGIAGMQAAITAAERGHQVTLAEASSSLGGQLKLASVPPHKQYLKKAAQWFAAEMQRKGVLVLLDTKATLEFVRSLSPDEIILATGAAPFTPSIEGIEQGLQAWDILAGNQKAAENKRVTIIGGGVVGCETALYLAQKGNDITILEMLPDLAGGLDSSNKADLLEDFKEQGICAFTGISVESIREENVNYLREGKLCVSEFDQLVIACGQRPVGEDLAEALRAEGFDLTVIGDADRPGKIIRATEQGYFAGINL